MKRQTRRIYIPSFARLVLFAIIAATAFFVIQSGETSVAASAGGEAVFGGIEGIFRSLYEAFGG